MTTTPTSIAALEISHERGFLPLQDPLNRLSGPFDPWENAAQLLPKLLVSDRLRRTIADLPPFPIELVNDDRERERAMVLLSYLGHAYVWGGDQPATTLPANLAVPWYEIAESLGRPPVLSYSSYALHNFFRFDASREIELGNIGLVQNFLGGIDEEWFILVHVEIERKAAPAIAALDACLDAAEARDAEHLENQLSQVASSLQAILATLRRMPEHCEPFIYYHRVRPYIHGWKNHPDIPEGVIYQGVKAYGGRPQQFRGETGAQSAIVPAMDAMLGVRHKEDMLSSYLREMRTYMPPSHRAFLESLEARTPVRPFVERAGRKALTAAFNACVETLEAFRSLHLEYAAAYIFRQAQTDPKNPHAVGTGGTPFMEYLKKHRDETAENLVK
jgi:indoleamine 2,3-dioxygenase